MMDLSTIQEVQGIRETMRSMIQVRKDVCDHFGRVGEYSVFSMILRADTNILRLVHYALTLQLDEDVRAYFERIKGKVGADATEAAEMMTLLDLVELQRDAMTEREISGVSLH
jgi:hypothetical protein